MIQVCLQTKYSSLSAICTNHIIVNGSSSVFATDGKDILTSVAVCDTG